jgi:hypothetical protein
MKRKLAFAAMSMLGGLIATPASADDNQSDHSGFYAGGGINLYFVDKDDAATGMPITFEDQPSPGAFMGRVGYAFNDYIAIEAEAGIGGARSDFEGPGIEGEIGVSGPVSAHLVLTMPVGEGGAYLLGKAGYSSVSFERELNGVDQPDLDASGGSFGAGAGIRNGNWDFRGEYSFLSGGDASSGVLGFFALYNF